LTEEKSVYSGADLRENIVHTQSRKLVEVEGLLNIQKNLKKGIFFFTSINMESMSSTVTQQRMEVEQLRREAAMKRIPVSQAVDDIKRFAMDHMMQDHLIVGFASEKANPFREKTWSCDLL